MYKLHYSTPGICVAFDWLRNHMKKFSGSVLNLAKIHSQKSFLMKIIIPLNNNKKKKKKKKKQKNKTKQNKKKKKRNHTKFNFIQLSYFSGYLVLIW